MTLLELTVVVMVLLSLVTILFVGARAWKRGSDRALCVVKIESVQKAVRGYSNIYALDPGATVPGLYNQLIGLGRFVETTPVCPAGGGYTYGQAAGINTIPPFGTLYMECSLSTSDNHQPDSYADW